jgi:hypothetical protein
MQARPARQRKLATLPLVVLPSAENKRALAGFILRDLATAFAVPAVLVGAELAAIVPRPLARGLEQAHAITNYELPYIARSLQARLLWYEHAQDEPSHESLYEVLRARHRGTQARAS